MKSQNSSFANATPSRSLSSVFAEHEYKKSQAKHYPKLPNLLAITYLTLTTLISAYSGLLGPAPILLLYVMWLPLIRYRRMFILYYSRDLFFCITFSAWCCLSALWSDYRPLTLHGGLEFVSTILCTVLIARLVRTEALIIGISVGTVFVLIASIVSGNYGADPFTGDYSMVGLFGSKNQLGLFAEIGVYFSLLGLLMKQRMAKKLLYGVFPFFLSLATLYMSRSATSVLSLAVTLGTICLMYLITRMPRSFRVPVFAGSACLLIVLGIAGAIMGWQDVILQSFGKDSTLTGRTFLWSEGFRVGMASPIIGHGYNAFWVQGRLVAEQLWYKFGIYNRGGFHFHNLYVELFVELGAIGTFLMAWLLLLNLFKSLQLVLKHGMVLEYLLPFGLSVMFLIRSNAELDVMSQFSIGTILCFSILPRFAIYKREYAETKNPPTIKP